MLLQQLKKQERGKRNEVLVGAHDQAQELLRVSRAKTMGRIIRESTYSETDSAIGTKVTKVTKLKPVHRITEDLLLSVR